MSNKIKKLYHVKVSDVNGLFLFDGIVDGTSIDDVKDRVRCDLMSNGTDLTFATFFASQMSHVSFERGRCERMIFLKMREIAELYKEYNPEADYLTLCMFLKGTETYSGNNSYNNTDADYPINFWTDGQRTYRQDLYYEKEDGTP